MNLGLEKDVVAYTALLASLEHGIWSDSLHVLSHMEDSFDWFLMVFAWFCLHCHWNFKSTAFEK